ncbi:glycoside hydrolase family 3 N-terminal domain-containing protein [Cohnella boryungensis]|uniref:Glycoside hydrolase family 3 N-terminal domain-containing protein n=1 Tax=Cohnella boryungensis TaxID=768479 RepID=A0ABV8S3B0_9BACL
MKSIDTGTTGTATEERVHALIRIMTLEEKIGQLLQPFGWQVYRKESGGIVLTEQFKRKVGEEGGIGALYGVLRADPWSGVTLLDGLSPEAGAEALNEIQRYAVEHSRLGIPILFGEECSHGHMAIGATVFPVPLLLGSTWNADLYRDICRAIARETRSQGGAAAYSPVLDVVRDPRWGRTEECFGEDPYLIGEFAVAAVEGLQGPGLDSKDSLIATLKHFAGYGSPEGGRNAGPAHMGPRELHEVDLHPFRKAVAAGAGSVMAAYNEIDGIPCTSSAELLTETLRQEWGFDGFVTTDCGAIEMLISGHDVAQDGPHAAAMALKAGIDMEMSGEMFGRHLQEALHRGLIDEAHIDEAVGRVLTAKFRLGLFDSPYIDPAHAKRVNGCSEHLALAREAAQQGIILLKNEDEALPLSPSIGKVAVIGPNANRIYNQLGDYTSPQAREGVVTLLDGILAKLGRQQGERVLYAPGCGIRDESRSGLDYAVEKASLADAIVLALGGSSARDFGEGSIDLRTGASVVNGQAESEMECGEGIDRTDLRLLGAQLELAQRLRALGKPLIVVYMNGRPVVEPWIDEHADALLEAWYPGQLGGAALADILFGDVNPSGRLTISVPRHVGQLPIYYNGKRSRGKRYLEMDLTPLYPFGYGLSYTEFEYGQATVQPQRITKEGTATASVTITNVGTRAGMEVVQLYVTDEVASVARPAIELKGFKKVSLQPGESREVSFPISREQLQMLNGRMEWTVEAGEFQIKIGPNCERWTSDKLIVVPDEEG